MESERGENYNAWAAKREAHGEKVGGGFIVMRRSNKNGRLKQNNRQRNDGSTYAVDPFEHATYEAAVAEARRLAEKYPHATFSVFEQKETVEGLDVKQADAQPAST